MRITDRITADGRRLFQLRGVMPLVLVVPLGFALEQMAHFELYWGKHVEDLWLAGCVCLSALGLLVRCVTVAYAPAGTSGRSRGAPGAATLATLGMYSVVRNPLYVGNGIMWLGVALATTSVWFALVSVLVYWLYIERVISAEEAFLAKRFGAAYESWVARTPCFLPRFSLWRAPTLGFSLRAVLRREYPALIALGAAFTLVEFISNALLVGEPVARWFITDRRWVIFCAVTVACGMGLRLLKKLHVLDVADR
ncbi:MAG TPA: isoprenylcysteine carboxylmethyltransferase family protein [Steroidobacteraceae bacterium]|nr:isoprenylcysteine carboxylmethyltransferase family protein [Steroidobacteraceae bacterium]